MPGGCSANLAFVLGHLINYSSSPRTDLSYSFNFWRVTIFSANTSFYGMIGLGSNSFLISSILCWNYYSCLLFLCSESLIESLVLKIYYYNLFISLSSHSIYFYKSFMSKSSLSNLSYKTSIYAFEHSSKAKDYLLPYSSNYRYLSYQSSFELVIWSRIIFSKSLDFKSSSSAHIFRELITFTYSLREL